MREIDKMSPRQRKLQWFRTEHLREDLRPMVEKFAALAQFIADNTAQGPEQTLSLQKLLEAKDEAVRALVTTKED